MTGSTKLMQDTVTPSVIPPDPWAVAGYGIGGSWPDYPALVSLFPQAHHLKISPTPGHGDDFDAVDSESRDYAPQEAAEEIPKLKPPNLLLPCGYASASAVEELIDLTVSQGLKREQFFVWSAHYNFVPHICGPGACEYPKADFTQFTDHEFALNIDGSMVPAVGIFRDTVKPKPPVDPHHYLWFASSVEKGGLPGGPFKDLGKWKELDERHTVKKYDTAMMHPHLHEHELDDLKDQCHALAIRINTKAHEQAKGGLVPWNDFRRFGWREQQLLHRAAGHQIVTPDPAKLVNAKE
jgi:hypothetical protein